MIIELKKVRPLLRRGEYEEEEWREYEVLALLTDEKDIAAFVGFIKRVILEALDENIVILRFSEIAEQILNRIKNLFQDHPESKVYPKSRNRVLYKPGVVVAKINTSDELETVLRHWGRVDLLDLIASKQYLLDSVLESLETDIYKSSAESLLSVLNVSTFIIRDSGDGNEAEIIYKRKDEDYIRSLLFKASKASGASLSSTANN